MGPRGWKESGLGEGAGAQRKESGRERVRALGAGGRVSRSQRGGGKTPKMGAGEWGRPWRHSAASLRRAQHSTLGALHKGAP